MAQRPPEWSPTPTPVLVVTRYRVDVQDGGAFRARARAALEALAAQPGLLSGQLARATDDPARWVLTALWESVGHYRRALSAHDVRLAAVPLLSQAIDEPTAFEVLDGRGAWDVTADSALAPDAAEVRLGEASP